MKAIEFITAVEKETDQPEARLSELYGHFKAGRFTPNDIFAAYKQRDTPRFIAFAQSFTDGKAFLAQAETFDQWASGENRKHDREAVDLYWSLKDAAQLKSPEIDHFITARILGRLPSRKEIEDEPVLMTKHFERWKNDNQRNGWMWR